MSVDSEERDLELELQRKRLEQLTLMQKKLEIKEKKQRGREMAKKEAMYVQMLKDLVP